GFCNETGEQGFCSANNVKEPVKTWTPTAAVCGMEYYNSDSIPQWKNSLLVVTLKNSRLYQLQLNGTQTGEAGTTEFLNNVYGRMRDVCVAPNGKVYICTGNGSNDKIVVVSR
ncbi:MAG TPA: PQQ-dependent sugar dehydrogenase, partial [Flavisolibacter sp.]|nr:PQQ-dependent sugar dehydrogenase [Flavisolibacter sp.]